MATEVRFRRGTTADITPFVPAQSEIIHNVTTNRLHVGDGTTQGGHELALVNDIAVGLKFDNLAAVTTTRIQANVNTIRIDGGVTKGDMQPLFASRVTTEPTHSGKVKSLDGAWWVFLGAEIDLIAFGAVKSPTVNNFQAWVAAADWSDKTDGVIIVTAGTYHFGGLNDFKTGRVAAIGEVTFISRWTLMPPRINVVSGVINFNCSETTTLITYPNRAVRKAEPYNDFVQAGHVSQEKLTAVPTTDMPVHTLVWPLAADFNAVSAGVTYNNGEVSIDNTNAAMLVSHFITTLSHPQMGVLTEVDIKQWSGNNPVRCIVLRSISTVYVIWNDSSKSTSSPTLYWRNLGNNTTGEKVLRTQRGPKLQGSADFVNGRLGVKFLSHRKAAITVNGNIIGLVTPADSGSFDGFGFGYFNVSAGGNYSVNFPTKTLNAQLGVNPVDILTFGDSITDGNYDTWAVRIQPLIHGSAGIHVNSFKNIGVSGYNAGQLVTQLNGENAENYSLAIGMIGTNDIQGQTNITTFISLINTVIDKFDAAGVPLVLGIPPLYYSQTEAEQYGQKGATPNNSAGGAMYRGALLSTIARAQAAGKVVVAVDFNRHAPLNLARHIDPPVSGYLSPMTTDNIHPSGFMAQIMAMKFAEGVVAALACGSGESSPFKVTGRMWSGGWGNGGGFNSYYAVQEDGMKRLVVNAVGPATGASAVIMRLPAMLRPTNTERRLISATSNGVYVQITSNGNVTVHGDTTVACFDISYF